MSYKHGTYGKMGDTRAQNAAQSGTIPVYFGTAPVHLVRGYNTLGIINSPVKLTSWRQSQGQVGYSSVWEDYTLCEAQKVHFNNPLGNIGPVYVVNVLDPDVHRKAEQVTKSLTFTNGRAEFISHDIILDTLEIEEMVEGEDYTLSYNYTKNSVIITLTDKTVVDKTVSFHEVDASAITADDIVGGVTDDGQYSGIGALELLYARDFQVATLLGAPGWSHIPEVYNSLVSCSNGINGKWMAYVSADIPVEGVTTKKQAIEWKDANGYTSEKSSVCWPMAQDSEGNIYHTSTIDIWQMQSIDAKNGDIPGETSSNKEVPCHRQYFGEGVANQGFDDTGGNELNEEGIKTIVPFGGKWVLWGGHTAAYKHGVTTDARKIFDTYIRMLCFVVNSFMKEWGQDIDKPMTVQLRDLIINRENNKLAGYVSQGFLVGKPECLFAPDDNSTKDIVNGDFLWDIAVTPTPQFKSGTVRVSYTDEGLSVYF